MWSKKSYHSSPLSRRSSLATEANPRGRLVRCGVRRTQHRAAPARAVVGDAMQEAGPSKRQARRDAYAKKQADDKAAAAAAEAAAKGGGRGSPPAAPAPAAKQ